MKVLFQSRLDLFKKPGGDTVQIRETKRALEKLGVNVDIDCSINKDVDKYDIVHVFNLDWVCEPYLQIRNAKKYNKKVVLSPIHHSLREFERYEESCRYGLVKLGNLLIPHQPSRDVARNLVKGLIFPKKLKPALIQLAMGIRKQQKLSVEMADYILVQTELEAKDIRQDYKTGKFKWAKVVNGINPERFKKGNQTAVKDKFDIPNKYILCVGRVEPRKNQLSLIEAFKELRDFDTSFKGFGLVFVGSLNKHHPTYVKKFKDFVAHSNLVYYLGFVNQENLSSLYAKSSIFACPSWFETTGLVYLEAAVSGSKSLVASSNRVREYLGENAVYCDPGVIESIKSSLKMALKPTVKRGFPSFVRRFYTWENCAKQTLEVYEKVLKS